MATVRSIVQDALVEIGVLAEGETMSAAQGQLGLLRFQNQLDAWLADRLSIAVSPRVTFTLLNGTNTMTIGDGGDIDTPRPTWFNSINYIVPGSSPEVEVPLGEMDDDSYATLSIKDLESNLPTQFYYNSTTPLGTLFFWPTVTQDVDMALYYPKGVAIPTSLNSTVVGPPGYAEAFMYQLALRLARPFGRDIDQSLRDDAARAFANMTRPNNTPGLLGVDAALVPTYGGAYNIYSDTTTGSSGR